VLLASWVLVPLAFLTLNQSKLPQYVLPLFPAFALAAAANLTRHGHRVAWRPAAALLALLGVALATLPWWLPARVTMAPETRAAIPRTAAALGVVTIVAAVLLAVAARRWRLGLAAVAYALPVLAVPFVSGDLMRRRERAVGGAAGRRRRGALERRGRCGRGDVLAIAVYPPSLPFYLGRWYRSATATGAELTSNWIVARAERYRALPGTALPPTRGNWRGAALAHVQITRSATSLAPELSAAAASRRRGALCVRNGPCRPGSSDVRHLRRRVAPRRPPAPSRLARRHG
jgi:hypothetical protein